jgi:hypothetical protein
MEEHRVADVLDVHVRGAGPPELDVIHMIELL